MTTEPKLPPIPWTPAGISTLPADYSKAEVHAYGDARAAHAVAQMQGEPVFLVCTGEVFEGRETYTRHEGSPPPLCDFEGPLYAPATAEQPQAREITDAEIDGLLPIGLDFPGSDWQQRLTRDNLHCIVRAAIALANGRG